MIMLVAVTVNTNNKILLVPATVNKIIIMLVLSTVNTNSDHNIQFPLHARKSSLLQPHVQCRPRAAAILLSESHYFFW